jgi:hypothetical protein
MRKLILLAILAAVALASPAFAGQHCRQWCDANGSGRCDIYCD